MIDEHFMRDWSDNHDAFSAGVTRMLAKASCGEAHTPDHGTDLRYRHGNRLFVAIVAGLLAGVIVASTAGLVEATAAPAAAKVAYQ